MNNCKECTIRAARSGMFALVAGILGATAGMASAAENACVQAFPDDITLRAAIDAAPANPKKNYTIVLTDDCNLEHNDPNDSLVVDGRISIVGNGNSINEDFGLTGDYFIFVVEETGNLTLNDVNLIGNDNLIDEYSSAIFNDGGTVTYNGGQMSGFIDVFGAIVNVGKMTLNGVTIVDNLAQIGGGILNAGQLVVNNSFIGVDEYHNSMPNTAGLGGGIYNAQGGIFNDEPGEISLNNTVVADNLPDPVFSSQGGGVYNDVGATLYLNSGSLIEGNSVNDDGAGIYNAGTVNINRAEILSNSATNDGGGIYNTATGTVTVNRGSISGNDAGGDGGGVYNAGTLTNYKFGSITGNANNDDVYDVGTCASYGGIGTVSNGSCPPSNP